ncbi:MAG: GNAT family N-acetyltransferase [Clostridiales bacterium]|nr:GNAT family N-acetyltransferase [Clostridiales bacterium]
MSYVIKPLAPETWDDFEKLAQRHNGVWGGCWCIWFHQSAEIKRGTSEENKALKKALVLQGRAHAALVYLEEEPVGWCQYGSPQELPAIYHRKEVETGDYVFPDWRITCIFVDNRHRGKGVAKAAVEGALDLIRQAGGGIVETYPQNTEGEKVSSPFLYNGTQSLFESCGFEWIRRKGKNHAIMRIEV